MTKRKPTAPKRRRGKPLQVYLSEVEHRTLDNLARQQGLSLSALVRRWLERVALRARARDTIALCAKQPVYKCASRTCPGYPYQAAHPCAESLLE